jgi:hypothetical protein
MNSDDEGPLLLPGGKGQMIENNLHHGFNFFQSSKVFPQVKKGSI